MANIRLSHFEDGVATITLDRPHKKNALSVALREEVLDALEHLRADVAVSCVVVTGEGDTFSAGFDLSEFAIDDDAFQRQLWDSSDRFHHALLRFPLPLIAAVNGPALAGGFDLAVLCDLRIASNSARSAIRSGPSATWSTDRCTIWLAVRSPEICASQVARLMQTKLMNSGSCHELLHQRS